MGETLFVIVGDKVDLACVWGKDKNSERLIQANKKKEQRLLEAQTKHERIFICVDETELSSASHGGRGKDKAPGKSLSICVISSTSPVVHTHMPNILRPMASSQ